MTETIIINNIGKLIIDLLVANERLQFALKNNKSDVSDSIYLLYSSALKLINKVVIEELRKNRLFRLKYHHILSNDSVEEYLYHCLSKILSEVLDEENSYQRFIQPVAELHMKLISIVSQVHLLHYAVVCSNRKVKQELSKSCTQLKNKTKNANDNKKKPQDGNDIDNVNDSEERNETVFLPVYYLPSQLACNSQKKSQFLTFHAINKHYIDNDIDPLILAMLLDFDNSFADFELEFVCQVNKSSIISPECAEKTMDVAVLFAEAVQWAHRKGLIRYSSIADCDIEIMVGVPRLSVLYGCGVTKHGPLSEWALLSCRNQDKANLRLAPVFQNHYKELARLRRQLNVLNGLEIAYLGRLLVDHCDASHYTITADCLTKIKVDDRHHLVSGDVHAIFKLISFVSDQMQSEHASDYRFFMEVIYKLYKDDPDDNSFSSPLPFTKSLSTPDLFQENGYFSCLNNVEEAVEALSFDTLDHQPQDDNDKPSMSYWDIKNCNSLSSLAEKKLQPADCVNSAVPYVIDLNVQFQRPQWQDDSSCSKCCHCGVSFNLFRRRHHCRRCGYLFCNSCWGTKVTLPALGIHCQVPVCIECEEFIQGKHKEAAVSTERAT